MKKILFIITFLFAVSLIACQKDFTISNNTNNPVNVFADDTSKILTVIDYSFAGGVIVDSAIKILRNATVNGQKKITLTEISASLGDTFYTVYKYNSSNQLTEIKSVDNTTPSQYERGVFFWNDDKPIKYEWDSTGVVKGSNTFTYSPAGALTKISLTQIPQQDTVFSGGSISSYGSLASELFIMPDFSPVRLQYRNHFYLSNNNNTGLPFKSWDTTNIFFNIVNGDLVKESAYRSGTDTNSVSFNPTNVIKDTVITMYSRSLSDNAFFTGKYKALYGDKLYTLFQYLRADFSDFLLPEAFFENKVFTNRSLITIDDTHVSWYNGILQFSSPSITQIKYTHFFDSQNRLIRSVRFGDPSSNIITSGMRIIYP